MGKILRGSFINNTSGGEIDFDATIDNTAYAASSDCSTSQSNDISLSNMHGQTDFTGAVECSSQGGVGDTTATQQPSSMAGSSQDSDGDGIPDSSDKCIHNSHHRCFKEGGDTNTTTTSTNQQPQSSSNRSGNQTR